MKRVVETSYVRTQQQPQLRAPRNLSGTDTLPHSTFESTYTFGVSIQSYTLESIDYILKTFKLLGWQKDDIWLLQLLQLLWLVCSRVAVLCTRKASFMNKDANSADVRCLNKAIRIAPRQRFSLPWKSVLKPVKCTAVILHLNAAKGILSVFSNWQKNKIYSIVRKRKKQWHLE